MKIKFKFKFIVVSLVAFATLCFGIVMFQDFLIFAELKRFLTLFPEIPEAPRTDVDVSYPVMSDGTSLEVWKYSPKDKITSKKVALIVRGNRGSLNNMFDFQSWLADSGIKSYVYNFRGFGSSAGWPSEANTYSDLKEMYKLVQKSEKVKAEDIIIVGYSLGSGPAAWLAAQYPVSAIVLFGGYYSLESAARYRWYGFLAPFLHIHFETAKYLNETKAKCVVVAHGEKDPVIPVEESHKIEKEFSSKKGFYFVFNKDGAHDDVLYRMGDMAKQDLFGCLGQVG